MITHGPLQWPLISACNYVELGLTPEQVLQVEQAAREWLWQSTAARFGTRLTVWRPKVTPADPTSRPVDAFAGLGWLSPAAAGWVASHSVAGGCVGAPQATVTVPGPVASVTTVTVDGADLSQSGWQLAGDQLTRTGGGTWPTQQDTDLPATAAGTWQVTYVRGRAVPVLGQRAAGLLACELGKRFTGAKDCKIPVNATTVARNGTTITLDKNALQGLTNLPEVDAWIRSVNPGGQRRPPRVWAPEQRTAAR